MLMLILYFLMLLLFIMTIVFICCGNIDNIYKSIKKWNNISNSVQKNIILFIVATGMIFLFISIIKGCYSAPSKPVIKQKQTSLGGFSEYQRKQIFRELLRAEDKADRLATEVYPMRYIEMIEELEEGHKRIVRDVFGITKKQEKEIIIEGVKKRWDL